MIQHQLVLLTDELDQIQTDLKKVKKPSTISFYNSRIKQLKQRIREFGQRSNIVMVVIVFIIDGGQIESRKIYYTGISMSDAMDYTRSLIEFAFKVIKIDATEIPVGKLEPLKNVIA